MTTREQSPWLFGPAPDLLLGSGVLYLLILSLLVLGGEPAQGAVPALVFSFAILIFSGAHYGATLLRVYEHESERRTYRNFSVYATALLIAMILVALHSPLIGSILITVYLTWSPWHYSGQNYGIAVMMLRRRGVDITPSAKRWFHATFVLSYLSAFLNFHFEGGIGQSDPLGYTATAGGGFGFISLGLPGTLRAVLMPAVGMAYLVSVAVSGALLRRAGGNRALVPAALLVCVQAAWFSIPHLGYHFAIGADIPVLNLRPGRNFQAYFVWVALGHALQYLWITTYYARSDRRWKGYGNYLGKAFVFGNAAWAAPVILLAPDLFRGADYDTGLAMCVAATVNLQHFVLDGAIWKLRNPRIAAILLERQPDQTGTTQRSKTASWIPRLAWACAGLFCLLNVAAKIEIESRFPAALASRDYAAATVVLDRAAWYGRDSAILRAQLANALVQERKPMAAIRQYWRSLDLDAHADGYTQLGTLTERSLGLETALYAYQRGLERFPEDIPLAARLGRALEQMNRYDEARPHLERALEAQPEDQAVREALERVQRRSGP